MNHVDRLSFSDRRGRVHPRGVAGDGALAVSDETPRAEVGPDAEDGGGETAPDRRQASVGAERGGGSEREAGKRRVGRGPIEVLISAATEIQWTLSE